MGPPAFDPKWFSGGTPEGGFVSFAGAFRRPAAGFLFRRREEFLFFRDVVPGGEFLSGRGTRGGHQVKFGFASFDMLSPLDPHLRGLPLEVGGALPAREI